MTIPATLDAPPTTVQTKPAPAPVQDTAPVLRILTLQAQTALLRLRTYYSDELTASTQFALSTEDRARLHRLSTLVEDIELTASTIQP